jgi:hypothetical protein
MKKSRFTDSQIMAILKPAAPSWLSDVPFRQSRQKERICSLG